MRNHFTGCFAYNGIVSRKSRLYLFYVYNHTVSIISCFPAWDRMREDWKQKRKQAPEPDGGGACVWILNLSLWSSVNALYQNV